MNDTTPPRQTYWFPSRAAMTYASPGCALGRWGGTHCSATELDQCLRGGHGLHVSPPQDLSHPWRSVGAARIHPIVLPHSAEPRFIAVVREPVTRLQSEFYWWAHTENGPPLAWTMGAYNASLRREGEDDLAPAFSRWVRSPYNTASDQEQQRERR